MDQIPEVHCQWNFIFWNGFIRILSWITCQLGWKVGNGLKIRLGVDLIDGIDSSYHLREDLRDYLTDYGISNLAQAQNLEGHTNGLNCWYSATYLSLGVVWPLINDRLLSMAYHMAALRLEIMRIPCSGCLIKKLVWSQPKKLTSS